MLRYFILLIFSVLVVGNPVSNLVEINPSALNGRIVGGSITSINEFPYLVALESLGFGFCGGSIISKNWILTAGHCASYPSDWITVRAGTSHLGSGGTVHSVAKIIRHENYKTNVFGVHQNDVALLQLNEPIEFDTTHQPIVLFQKNEEVVEGSSATISGWGATVDGGSPSDVLLTVNISIVSKRMCDSIYALFGGIPEGQFCAAHPDGGKDSCQGDSGGPLTIDGRLAGIVSWGNGCGEKGYPRAYTDVAAYKEWIVKNAGLQLNLTNK